MNNNDRFTIAMRTDPLEAAGLALQFSAERRPGRGGLRMSTTTLIDSIYQRHTAALQLVNCDHGPARMALWLALTELADRLAAPTQPDQPTAQPTRTIRAGNGSVSAASFVGNDSSNVTVLGAPTTPTDAPAALTFAVLDDTSRHIVRDLDQGNLSWRDVHPADRRIITLAAIKELGEGATDGLTIDQFERTKPRWLPRFQTLSSQLNMTWNQMNKHAQEPF